MKEVEVFVSSAEGKISTLVSETNKTSKSVEKEINVYGDELE